MFFFAFDVINEKDQAWHIKWYISSLKCKLKKKFEPFLIHGVIREETW